MLFHTHYFQEIGNSIYCRCGEIKSFPCEHKWKDTGQVIDRENPVTKTIFATVMVLQCEKCGDIKTKELS
jgi:hypothetical protein